MYTIIIRPSTSPHRRYTAMSRRRFKETYQQSECQLEVREEALGQKQLLERYKP